MMKFSGRIGFKIAKFLIFNSRKVSTSAREDLDAAVDELSNLSIKVNEELDETIKEQIDLNVCIQTLR